MEVANLDHHLIVITISASHSDHSRRNQLRERSSRCKDKSLHINSSPGDAALLDHISLPVQPRAHVATIFDAISNSYNRFRIDFCVRKTDCPKCTDNEAYHRQLAMEVANLDHHLVIDTISNSHSDCIQHHQLRPLRSKIKSKSIAS